MKKTFTLLATGALLFAGTLLAEENEVSRFSTMMEVAVSGGPPDSNWRFLWNAAGRLGHPAEYEELEAIGTPPNLIFAPVGRPKNGAAPGPAPAGWAQWGRVKGGFGGVPGHGAANPGSDGYPHGVILAYRIPYTGVFGINSGTMRNVLDSPRGTRLSVWLNDEPFPAVEVRTDPGVEAEVEFDLPFQSFEEGETVYISIDADRINDKTTVLLDFAIVEKRP